MVLQNYQNFIEMTSNMIYIVALGVGLKCPHKIHLNTQWGGGVSGLTDQWTLFQQEVDYAHLITTHPFGFSALLTALKKRMWVASFLLIDLRDVETKRIKNERILFNNAYGLLCWLESLLFAFRKVMMIFKNRLNKGKGNLVKDSLG